MECIVPNKMVPSKATLILLQWVFTYYHTAPIGSVKSALEWIIGKQCTLLNIGQFLHQHLVCWVNTRVYPKVPGQFAYLGCSIPLSPSKYSPFARTQRSQRFCHAWKHPWKCLFGIVSSTRCDSSWISSMVSNLWPFIRSFGLGKRKKSQGARSGEYGGPLSCCSWPKTVKL